MSKATDANKRTMFKTGKLENGHECDRCGDAAITMSHTGTVDSVTVLCAKHWHDYRAESRERWNRERGHILGMLGVAVVE